MKRHLIIFEILWLFSCESKGLSYDPTSGTFNDINVVLSSSHFNDPSECPKVLQNVKVRRLQFFLHYFNDRVLHHLS